MMDPLWLGAVGIILLLAGLGALLFDAARRKRSKPLHRRDTTQRLDETTVQSHITTGKQKSNATAHPQPQQRVTWGRKGKSQARQAPAHSSLVTRHSSLARFHKLAGATVGAHPRITWAAAIGALVVSCLGVSSLVSAVNTPPSRVGSVVVGVAGFVGNPAKSDMEDRLSDYMLRAAAGNGVSGMVVRLSGVRPTTPEGAEAERARIEADFLWWGEVGPAGGLTVSLAMAPGFSLGTQPWTRFAEPDLGALAFPPYSQLRLPAEVGTDPLVPLTLGLAHLKLGNYAAAANAAWGAQATIDDAGGAGQLPRFIEATARIAGGDYAGAVEDFGKIKGAGGIGPEGLVNRGNAHLLSMSYGNASSDADRAIADRATDERTLARAYLLRGRARYRGGALLQGMEDLAESARLNPAHLPTMLDKAEAHYRQAQPEAARAELDALSRKAPDAAPAHRLMGLVRLMLGQPGEAHKSLAEAERIYNGWLVALRGEEARAHVGGDKAHEQAATESILRLNREIAGVYLYQGMAWADIARKEGPESFLGGIWRRIRGEPSTWERALSKMEEAGRFDPRRPDIPLQIGNLYVGMGEPGKAAEIWQQALALDPAAPGPYMALAGLQTSQGNPQAAAATLNSLLLNNASHYPAYEELYKLYTGLGDGASAQAVAERALNIAPQSAGDHLWQGKLLRKLGRAQEAAVELGAATADPTLWEAHLHLGEIYREASYNPEALAEYRQVLAVEPNNPTALLEGGRLAALAGESGEAQKWFERLASVAPQNVDGQLALLQLLLSKGDVEGAIAAGRRAVAANDEKAEAHFYLGEAFEVAQNRPAAAEQYRASLQRNPEDFESFIRLARTLYRDDRYLDSIKASEGGIALRANDPQPYRWKAQAQLALRDADGALLSLGAALQLSPGYADALALASRGFALKGDDASALSYAERAIQADGRNPAGALALGEAHLARGRGSDALAAYGSALSIDPNLTEAIVGQGRAYQLGGERERALKLYADALERDGRSAEACLYAGHASAELGRPNDALRQYRRAVEIRPNWPLALYYLGRVYVQRKELNNAQATLLKATQFDPNLVEAWFALGLTERERGQRKEASEALLRATQLNAGYADAWLYLGLTYEEMGERPQSAEAFTRARDSASDPSVRGQAEKGLERVR